MSYLELIIAIVGEVVGSNLLKLSNGFAKLQWGLLALLSYGICFYFAALAMKGIKLNVAYATWGGAGILLTCLTSYFIFHEGTNPWQLFGIGLIIVGVFIANFATK
ncbi:MAG: multidrug efflux SMR transporter [Lactobacillus sp.]|nr:multidrug efflux SMR transporter [Lactobacillus sp.]MCH3906374.1 multidrug efflux SMR transporter [Lactobacillus sp.]MCH3990051.1 multidrug efflux SMR transporter [Lactobacillus sp.]MCH4069235.1 multidrug efflux SMR transporter [Lactobacillus sp.]MCI1303537.1 multidrug efflux SMR transporter [Lactobacillus sp.]